MSVRALRALLLCIFVLAGAATQVTNGRLEGTVQDGTGAVVPNATVTAVNAKTGAELRFTSDAQGAYLFTVPPGIYTLTVELGGFRKAVVSNIEMNVGSVVAQTVKLELGATSETVQVEASSVAV